MILVGQYDSPYVRRVAISLRVLGFEYRHDTRSVFDDFESMRDVNPLARIPSLILDGGATLVDSNAVLDWLDQEVGPDRALLPTAGERRRDALQRIALATGVIDKIGAAVYERVIRPSAFRWPEWIERLTAQGTGALEKLATCDWSSDAPIDQPQITMVCVIRYMGMAAPELMPAGRYPSLDALAERWEAHPAFQATYPADYAVPSGD